MIKIGTVIYTIILVYNFVLLIGHENNIKLERKYNIGSLRGKSPPEFSSPLNSRFI